MKSQTLAQKIIARAAGRDHVSPGEIVMVQVDLLMAHDSSGPRRWRPRLEKLGARLWNPSKVVIVSDHYVPASDSSSATILQQTRQFASDYGVENFFDMQGICHVILPEKGLLRPGLFVAGGDSHTPMAGAFGCYAAGFGATDTTAIAITGETWTTVPETVRVELTGRLHHGVTAKDIMLTLCRDLGMEHHFQAVEYTGEGVALMPMAERMVLSNMAAELGAETGLIAPDEVTLDYLQSKSVTLTDDFAIWQSDKDSNYLRTHSVNLDCLTPQIAAPHSPANTSDVTMFADVAVDQCYIGACVGAKLDDLRMAADILKGRQVDPSVRLLIAPATVETTRMAAAEGTLTALTDAGGILMPSGCGACAGMGAGVLARGEVCLSSTNRNFQGRMGDPGSSVYLGSPYAVAAAAVTGRITDPRELLPHRRAAA